MVVKINHATKAKGAYPIVLVSYDIACPAYKDANTAKFVKSWLTYVTSDEGQKTASSAAGSAPLPSTLRREGHQVHRGHQDQVIHRSEADHCR